MFYVISPSDFTVIAIETSMPPAHAYPGFIIVYSEEIHHMDEVVDPAAICTRFLRTSDKFIAGDGVDAARIEISEYGATALLDVNGDQVEVPLVNNYGVTEVVSEIPPEDLVIKGASGPLADCEVRIYVR